MKLVADPLLVNSLATEKGKDNDLFFGYLKARWRNREIDHVAHLLNDEISKAIDCTQCGNCCKVLNAAMDKEEMQRLAPHLSLSPEKFSHDYLSHDEIEDVYYIKTPPCVFLKDTKCCVYQQRPLSCAGYPHLDKPNFIYRTKNTAANYSCCPIVFNVVERLKLHFGYAKP